MATNSIHKNVVITPDQAKCFIKAIEAAVESKPKNVVISKPINTLSKEDLRKLFFK